MPRTWSGPMLYCLVLVGLAACGDDGPSPSRQPVTPQVNAMDHNAPSRELRNHTGLSALPQIQDRAAFVASLKRHDPGLSGTLLVDVTIDENGAVQKVAAAPRDPANRARAVLVDRFPDGKTVERPLVVRNNPALLPAAQKVMREVRFTPAERDGKPVPYTLRMTLGFQPGL